MKPAKVFTPRQRRKEMGFLNFNMTAGVTTPAALARMRRAGASVAGAATLLGKQGVGAFEFLSQGDV
ncbi:hypothetical protein BT96DRAFT_917347 [Gymnopus androsaceus JB14]|uniref:Uncharacterized protein n=1 Tax=Gymnopus androsaceus JB14 TaxID=1447944 RepID=A0A6A4I1E2_9AGAR|nr:hypothetical protein BT96DRAFT_917347 [Gymnopus androsaceus JB14]